MKQLEKKIKQLTFETLEFSRMLEASQLRAKRPLSKIEIFRAKKNINAIINELQLFKSLL